MKATEGLHTKDLHAMKESHIDLCSDQSRFSLGNGHRTAFDSPPKKIVRRFLVSTETKWSKAYATKIHGATPGSVTLDHLFTGALQEPTGLGNYS